MKFTDLFAEKPAAVDRGTREASERSAVAKPSEDRVETRRGGAKAKAKQPGEHMMIYVRVRRPVVEAVAEAVAASPIEFGTPADFYRRAIEHELQRRGLLKTYK